jgi:hypothetical protein
MYSQLTKSNDVSSVVVGAKPNMQFEQVKKEEVMASDAKKGW